MNAVTKAVMYLQVAALCFVTAFAHPDVKAKDFRIPIASFETPTFQGTTMFVDGKGTGDVQAFGPLTYTYEFVVDLTTGAGIGSAEFTTATGDTFATTITGLGTAEAPGFQRVVEEHTIVGGTGRFAGARGAFTLNRLVSGNSVSVGTVKGTILTPKSR